MKRVFIILEMVDIEPMAVHVESNIQKANDLFETIMKENAAREDHNTLQEIEGTLRIAGDDSYSVQLLERVVGR